MNKIQKAAFEHLTVDGHPERKQALRDLVDRGAFTPTHSEQRAENIFVYYVKDNPLALCAAGIQRFKEAIGIKPPAREIDVTVRLTLDDTWNDWKVSSGNYGFTHDSMVAADIEDLLCTFENTRGNKCGFVKAKMLSVVDA